MDRQTDMCVNKKKKINNKRMHQQQHTALVIQDVNSTGDVISIPDERNHLLLITGVISGSAVPAAKLGI